MTTKMARQYGRAPVGERLVAKVPHGHWKTLTLVAAIRVDGVTAPYVVDGAMDGAAFLAYVVSYAPGDGRLVSDGEIQSLAVLDHC